MEDFYGNTGAFRCLVEGGGDVAFVKHTTVMENCDGKRKEIWARNQLTADYQKAVWSADQANAANPLIIINRLKSYVLSYVSNIFLDHSD